jgi:CBS-domain-containing membrane protein
MTTVRPPRFCTRHAQVIWPAIAAALPVCVVGLLGVLIHQPLLFANLGPTAFLRGDRLQSSSAQLYNTIVGHSIGLSSAFLVVILLKADHAPPALSADEIAPVQVMAATISIGLAMFLMRLCHASHPPAAATTLLIALGSFKPTVRDAVIIMTGVLIVALIGEGIRWIRLRQTPRQPPH